MSSERYCEKHGVEKVWHSKGGGAYGWRCPGCAAEKDQGRNAEAKRKAFIALGGKCNQCGEADWCVLQIDHVNGDGAQERRELLGGSSALTGGGKALRYTAYREHFYANLGRYQLLCANCHLRKTRSNDEHSRATRKWGKAAGCTFGGVNHAT